MKKYKVFISYRRADEPFAAHLIAAEVKKIFGENAVFFDTRSIKPGTEWPKYIKNALEESVVIIAVIGCNWEGDAAKIREGDRSANRLLNPEDWVRKELSLALADKQKTVYPVLVHRKGRPERNILPDDMAKLTSLQEAKVSIIDPLNEAKDIAREARRKFLKLNPFYTRHRTIASLIVGVSAFPLAYGVLLLAANSLESGARTSILGISEPGIFGIICAAPVLLLGFVLFVIIWRKRL